MHSSNCVYEPLRLRNIRASEMTTLVTSDKTNRTASTMVAAKHLFADVKPTNGLP